MLSRLIHKLLGLATTQPTEQANRENHSPATHAHDKVEHTLNAALTSAQNGNTAQALELLAQIPVEKVDNPDTVAMIAHVRVLCGQLEEAALLLENALTTFDRSAKLLASLGNVRRLQQRFEDAEALYHEAVSVDPRYIPVQINLASLQLHLGHFQAAEATLKQGLLIQSGDPDLLRELGGVYFQQRRWPESSAAYLKAIEHAPDLKTRFSYGAALYQQGVLTDAQQVVAEIVETSPDDAAAQNLLGLIHRGLNELEEAEDCFNLALHYVPGFQDAAINLARLERQRGRMQAAIENYQLADSIGESSVALLTELGTALYDVGRFSEAEEALNRAIALKPSPHTHNAIGLLYLLGKGLPIDAEAEFQKAIALNPEYEYAQFNRCLAIQNQGDIEGAIACYDTLLEQYPNHPQLLWYKAHARLLAGDFTRAWDDYELRLNHELASKHNFTFPVWQGEPLAGKTLLIYSEQGLGDEIMFSSCLADVIQKAKHCVVACNPRLATLFARSFPEATIVEWKQTDETPTPYRFENVPKIDLQIPIGSLPRYFRRSRDSFPHHSGYLASGPNRVASWREKLDCLGQGLKVGVSWRGGTYKTRRDVRSIPLEMWQPILAQTNCHFISLQYTDCIEELTDFKAKFSTDIHHWQEAIDDYDETAALVSSLDMVITVCTSIVHLTGAVGRPAWVMVPAMPEWRYLREGNRMPWYPSVKLFRQNGLNEWEPILQQVSQALKERAESAVQRHSET